MQDKAAGRLGGLEKLWGFHHHHGLPEDADVQVNAEVWKCLHIVVSNTLHQVHFQASLLWVGDKPAERLQTLL